MTETIPVSGQPAWRSMLERWALYMPPGRPSERDVWVFRERLLAALEARPQVSAAAPAAVLVLGSTPELRSMLAALPQVKVTVIDYLLPMLEAMSELVTGDLQTETWVKGDWIEAPLAPGHFDAVVSDLVLANLPTERQHRLGARVAELLAPGGHWINRVDCVDQNSLFLDLDQLLERFISLGDTSQSTVCYLRACGGLRYWDPVSGYQSWKGFGEALSRYRDDERFVHPSPVANELMQAVWAITYPFDKPYWLQRKADLDHMLGEYFTIEFEELDLDAARHHERGYYVYDLKVR